MNELYWNGYLAGVLTMILINFAMNMALWLWFTRVRR